ncbi:MAG TPA: cell division protein FtsQ/DivIB [Rhodospirillales bacterium]|jgi:cell division protein FtsQ|nr:cell division protein FtsQ/DivIB [Rhodospirillales bacterium]
MKIDNKGKAAERSRPRRRATPLWRTGWARVVAVAIILSAATSGGWWLWSGGWLPRIADQARWALIAASAEAGLRVEEILVVGRNETSRQALLDAVRLARGAPIMAFDPQDAKRRIEALPWVRIATVKRMLPDTVLLGVVEREALALWQHKGRFALIDHDGTVIQDRGLERFSGLLVVVGKDAPVHAAALLGMLATQPNLLAQVKTAVRVGGRRWNLRFESGIDVRLPEENPASAWARLAEYERTNQVLARDVEMLDLRLPDRLIVRRAPRPERRPERRDRET